MIINEIDAEDLYSSDEVVLATKANAEFFTVIKVWLF